MKKSSSSSAELGDRPPPQGARLARRTSSSGRVSSLNDDEYSQGGHSSHNDYSNYMVMMPPTPDYQPDEYGDKPDGPGPYGSRHRNESQWMRNETDESGYGARGGGNASSGKLERRMSAMRANSKSMLLRSQTNDFDHNRWLFESKGKYGIGTAFWQQEDSYEDAGMSMSDFMDKPWKPLTRKLSANGAVLSPYRILILFRLVAMSLFLTWRIRNPNRDAIWLSMISIVCEIWFTFAWFLDILPKFNPINRAADLAVLKEKFESATPSNPHARSDLPGVDIFVTTADPDKEPSLVTANTVLSILSIDYPVEKVTVYISDDGGSILTFEAMAETVNFAEFWVPFCKKHNIEPRNPDSYFNLKKDPTKNKKLRDFVKDRRWIKREYDEFKVRINGLPEAIRKRCRICNSKEKRLAKEKNIDASPGTWMADGTHWPGTWHPPTADHSKGDHAGILQIMSKLPNHDPVMGHKDEGSLDFTNTDIRIPMFVYISREKRPGYDHHNKAGAMNALVRASAILSNGPFIINLDCDHYVYNCKAIREGMCYMMDRSGDRVCFVQFPRRFEGIDPSDRYANHNTVFFDGNMRALDGLQGPVYVGTGCMFRRYALYGYHPPRANDYLGVFGQTKTKSQIIRAHSGDDDEAQLRFAHPDLSLPKKFGNSATFAESIPVAEYQGRPLADHHTVKNGRPPGALLMPRGPLDAPTVAEAIAVISCWYENNTEWGNKIGWIYGSITEDVVTGYCMHNRGWRSIYCITKRDAFRGTAPINLTDRLRQVLRIATGSVQIFFSRYNAFLATKRIKFLQRIAYLNIAFYPFTSIFLVVYCFVPPLCLFTGRFIVQRLSLNFCFYVFILTILTTLISLLEVKWSGIGLEEWWRNQQFWLIGGTSAHLFAVIQGFFKGLIGREILYTLTSKSATEDEESEDKFSNFYEVKWSSLFFMPLTIMLVNIIAILIGFSRTVYSVIPDWNKLYASIFYSCWVLVHMYPFAKGLMGRRGRVTTIVYVWAGIISTTVSLLYITLHPP